MGEATSQAATRAPRRSLATYFHLHPIDNGMVEVAFIYSGWTGWAVPLCLSVRGLFHHAGYYDRDRLLGGAQAAY